MASQELTYLVGLVAKDGEFDLVHDRILLASDDEEGSMRPICKLYARICRKWGPRGMTFSAWLWARELEGKGYFLRELVDDTFMCFFDQYDHCAESYRREAAQQRGPK